MKKEVFESATFNYQFGQEEKFAENLERNKPSNQDMNYFAFEVKARKII